MRNSPAPVDLRRRNFLMRCCQGASAALIPPLILSAGLRRLSFCGFDSPEADPSSPEFHLHPHYRMPRPLDALLLKTQSGLDDFVTEKYADEIAVILAQWSSALLKSPQDLTAIEKAMSANFSGSSPTPANSRVVRQGPPIEIRQNTFSRDFTLRARRIPARTALHNNDWMVEDPRRRIPGNRHRRRFHVTRASDFRPATNSHPV